MAHLPRRLSAMAATTVLLTALGACGSGGSDQADSGAGASETPSESASATSTASPSESLSASGSPSGPVDSPKPSKAPTQTPSEGGEPNPTALPTPGTGEPSAALVGKLLSPKELPGLNDQTVWSEKQTGPEGSGTFGDCQKTSITDIGATDVVVRTYDAHGSQAGAQLVAKFADARSARRATAVLTSWHDSCKQRLDAPVKRVNPITDVASSKGKAMSYLVQFGQRDAEQHTFHGVGITRVGATISIVTIDVMGQDYNYEQGQEPASRAAAAAAGVL